MIPMMKEAVAEELAFLKAALEAGKLPKPYKTEEELINRIALLDKLVRRLKV